MSEYRLIKFNRFEDNKPPDTKPRAAIILGEYDESGKELRYMYLRADMERADDNLGEWIDWGLDNLHTYRGDRCDVGEPLNPMSRALFTRLI